MIHSQLWYTPDDSNLAAETCVPYVKNQSLVLGYVFIKNTAINLIIDGGRK